MTSSSPPNPRHNLAISFQNHLTLYSLIHHHQSSTTSLQNHHNNDATSSSNTASDASSSSSPPEIQHVFNCDPVKVADATQSTPQHLANGPVVVPILDTQWNHNNMVLVSSYPNGTLSFTPIKNPNAPRMENIHQDDRYPIYSLCMSSGSRYLTTTCHRNLLIWDLKSKMIIKQLRGHEAPVRKVLFDATDRHLLSGAEDGLILFHDANTSLISQQYRISEHPVTDLKFSILREQIFGAADEKGLVRLWDIHAQKEIMGGEFLHEAHTGKDGLSVVQNNNTSGKTCIEFCHKNHQLFITAGRDDMIHMWDISARRRAHSVSLRNINLEGMHIGGGIRTMSFCSDGKNLATGTESGHVLLFDVRYPDQPYHVIHASDTPIQCVRFQNAGRRKKSRPSRRTSAAVSRESQGQEAPSAAAAVPQRRSPITNQPKTDNVESRTAANSYPSEQHPPIRSAPRMNPEAVRHSPEKPSMEKTSPDKKEAHPRDVPSEGLSPRRGDSPLRKHEPPSYKESPSLPTEPSTLPPPRPAASYSEPSQDQTREKKSILDSANNILRQTEQISPKFNNYTQPDPVKSRKHADRTLDEFSGIAQQRNEAQNGSSKRKSPPRTPPSRKRPSQETRRSPLRENDGPKQTGSTFISPPQSRKSFLEAPNATDGPSFTRPLPSSQPLSPLLRRSRNGTTASSMGPTDGTPATFQALQRYIDGKVQDIKMTMHKEMRNYHTEMIKQFHQQQEDINEKLEQFMRQFMDISNENRQLREENQRLQAQMEMYG